MIQDGFYLSPLVSGLSYLTRSKADSVMYTITSKMIKHDTVCTLIFDAQMINTRLGFVLLSGAAFQR